MQKTTKELIEALSSGPVIKYIADHEQTDLGQIILKHKAILGIPTAQLVNQISSRKKAKDKLPTYYQHPGVVYPPSENLEQTSSEITARYKSDLVEGLVSLKNARIADLTGGFGIDSFFLSAKAKILDYVEVNPQLLELARYNHRILGAANIHYHEAKAEDFVRTTTNTFDLVYIDPSRRPVGTKRTYALEHSQPDVIEMGPEIFLKANYLLVKASPLLDIQAGIAKLPFVERVIVVSVQNECKEVLFLSTKNFSGTPIISAINLLENGRSENFEFSFADEQGVTVEYGDPGQYLFEPNASILKAGAFKSVSAKFNLKKLHPSTHLYTANRIPENFPGRKFVVEAFVKSDAAALKRFFPDGKANITTRNYPLTPDALKKKTGLKDGGDKFLIGFSGLSKKFLAVARRI